MIILKKHQVHACHLIFEEKKGIFQYPTGTGKTLIQSSSIANDIEALLTKTKKFTKGKAYVVLAPRIILANQLFSDIHDRLKKLGIDAQYLLVHSGRIQDNEDIDDEQDVDAVLKHLPYREIGKTTRSADIIKELKRANREKVPLVICGTYHSACRIKASKIPLRIVHCDEGHNTVADDAKGFGWVPNGFDNQSDKIFFFTATLKNTDVEDGVGMNNEKRYGPLLASMTPKEAVNDGLIVGPRIHIVSTTGNVNEKNEDAADAKAIIDSFHEHNSLLNVRGKILVICKGSKHLARLMEITKFYKDLRLIRKRLKVFDISSMYGPRINGESCDRETFLRTLQGLEDEDEALIFHIDILSEGIDIPGITGVMPMNNMKLSKFLQTLGRATRLHPVDRTRLGTGEIKPCEFEKHIKPVAWLILPAYGDLKEELKGQFVNWIDGLREYGFKAEENVFIKQSKGSPIPTQLENLNKVDRKNIPGLLTFIEKTCHDFEAEEEYSKIREHVVKKSKKNFSLENVLSF